MQPPFLESAKDSPKLSVAACAARRRSIGNGATTHPSTAGQLDSVGRVTGGTVVDVSVCNMVRVCVRSSTSIIHVHLMYCHVGGFFLLYITQQPMARKDTHRYTKTNMVSERVSSL
jgi:hypothetical protein